MVNISLGELTVIVWLGHEGCDSAMLIETSGENAKDYQRLWPRIKRLIFEIFGRKRMLSRNLWEKQGKKCDFRNAVHSSYYAPAVYITRSATRSALAFA
jgi:hypothetical protein